MSDRQKETWFQIRFQNQSITVNSVPVVYMILTPKSLKKEMKKKQLRSLISCFKIRNAKKTQFTLKASKTVLVFCWNVSFES